MGVRLRREREGKRERECARKNSEVDEKNDAKL